MANINANLNANARRWATIITYRECRHNQSRQRGRYFMDGCTEFRKAGEDMTPESLICAACGCHRNYHRREELSVAMDPVTHHLIHQMAIAPSPQAHVPVLGIQFVPVPHVVPVPPPSPPEENLGNGEEDEDSGAAESRRRARAQSDEIRAGARGWLQNA